MRGLRRRGLAILIIAREGSGCKSIRRRRRRTPNRSSSRTLKGGRGTLTEGSARGSDRSCSASRSREGYVLVEVASVTHVH